MAYAPISDSTNYQQVPERPFLPAKRIDSCFKNFIEALVTAGILIKEASSTLLFINPNTTWFEPLLEYANTGRRTARDTVLKPIFDIMDDPEKWSELYGETVSGYCLASYGRETQSNSEIGILFAYVICSILAATAEKISPTNNIRLNTQKLNYETIIIQLNSAGSCLRNYLHLQREDGLTSGGLGCGLLAGGGTTMLLWGFGYASASLAFCLGGTAVGIGIVFCFINQADAISAARTSITRYQAQIRGMGFQPDAAVVIAQPLGMGTVSVAAPTINDGAAAARRTILTP